MKIKVCGMTQADNIMELSRLPIAMMGFIFYSKSPRYFRGPMIPTPSGIDRVGVFVEETTARILELSSIYQLDFVQLHGKESVEQCQELRAKGLKVIKAISVGNAEDIALSTPYVGEVDLLLFDTATSAYGGSGVQFDWAYLQAYQGETPFLLSGGIGLQDAAAVRAFKHPQCVGVDLNSRFELKPGVKNIPQLQEFINLLQSHESN